MRSALVVVLVLVAGCADYAEYRTGGSGSPATRGATCKNAAPYGRSYGAALAKKFPQKNDVISTIESSVIASCESDKWPSDVLTCLGNAKDPNAMDGCISTLSADIQKKMEDSALSKLK
ncbi:MAG: hypothetical protein JNK04_04510 [Myxococcales bacterium]|nr:hypothetical protein [Myxococcales bacterium]